MRYRSEIDGLRAIAVLPVVFFHAGFQGLQGGYIGVDVFFVLSGFLITTIIAEDLRQGRFSLLGFYERRARRILPALVLVVAASAVASWFLLLPEAMAEFARSLIGVATFSSNVFFWRDTSYFATASEFKPMLHTWTLAIEEQFYIVFPLLFILGMKRGRRVTIAVLASIFVASLAMAQWGVTRAPSASFYLLHSRAWELLLGALAAFVPSERLRQTPLWLSNLLSAAGLLAILVPMVLFDEFTPFPSLYTLVPTSGAALVLLFAQPGTMVQWLLSLRVFLGIGLISYSIYLWHQPVFAFARARSLVEPSLTEFAWLCVLVLVLSVASYVFVETPFRKGYVLSGGKRLLATSGGALCLVAALGLAGHLSGGFPARAGEDVQLYMAQSGEQLATDCYFLHGGPLPTHPIPECLSGEGVDVVVLGDSHAQAQSEILADQLRQRGLSFYMISHAGCIPLQNFLRVDMGGTRRCGRFVSEVLDFAREADVDILVLSARFQMYLQGEGFDNGMGGIDHSPVFFVDIENFANNSSQSRARKDRVLAAMEDEILHLADEFDVVLAYPIPEAGWDVPQLLARAAFFDEDVRNVATSFHSYRARAGEIVDLFDSLAQENPNVFPARTYQAFCDEERDICVNTRSGLSLYYDDNHVSDSGAELTAPIIIDAIEAALQRPRPMRGAGEVSGQ